MKKFWTRAEIQSELEKSGYEVTYVDRLNAEDNPSPDNWIVYMPTSSNGSKFSDSKLHIITKTIQVVHLHKKKLDSIEQLMIDSFETELQNVASNKDTNTDYWSDYYEFEIVTNKKW